MDGGVAKHLRALHRGIVEVASDLAVFLVYDRPSRVEDRPDLARTHFAQRCVSDAQLNAMVEALRAVGVYVEVLDGDQAFIKAVAECRLHDVPRARKLVYNGVEGGVGIGGFQPGRKALVPVVADSFGLLSSNSNAYACAIGRHKYHYFTLLQALGLPVPPTWHFRRRRGWDGGRHPDLGEKVIVKSTYESSSVGVHESSVFVYTLERDDHIEAVADAIGQDVCVQGFVPGWEVCVPVLAVPQPFATRPVKAILAKAPGDPEAVMTFTDTRRPGALTHVPYTAGTSELDEIRGLACRAFEALELGAFARIDFRIDSTGAPWIMDLGVSPGIGASSSAYRSIASYGYDYGDFICVVMAASLAQHGLLDLSD